MARSWAYAGDVDWAENKLYLCENRVYAERRNQHHAKDGENRYVSVSPSVMALLKRWRAEQAATFLKLGITLSGYVLTAENGGPMHPDSPQTGFINSPNATTCRLSTRTNSGTQASLLIAQGVDILTVSKRLGRQSFNHAGYLQP